MSEETKKESTLYILTQAGGWADEIDDEQEVQETSKTSAWDKIEKPDVVPIGSSDFEIASEKTEDKEKTEKQEESKNFGPRNRNSNYRRDNNKQNGFFRDRKPRNGHQDGKWRRRNENDDQKDTRSRKPLVLAPRTVSVDNDETVRNNNKESPFGSAKPKETGREDKEELNTNRFVSRSSKPSFSSDRKKNQNRRYHNNERKSNDGFKSVKGKGSKTGFTRTNRPAPKETVSDQKETYDAHTHNPFSLLSEE